MLFPIIFVTVGVLALLAILYLVKTHRLKDEDLDALAARLRPIDARAFRNLISETEAQFLHDNLSFGDFRKVHAQRMLAAVEYVRCAAQNAAILLQLAEAARSSPDSEIVAAAERLLENAIRLRLYALQSVPRFYAAILFPGINRAPSPLFDVYDAMTRQVVLLGCLQYPTYGMASSL
ncbi:MAG TPA: hypothetical protein VFA85_15105 [Terriglobales bacterium]|nr:hypothetical protein [Terriglobales bacterium]